MSESKGRFLVVRGGAIGDFILTLPVFSAIRETFPAAHIELLGYPNVTPLALESGLVDGARSIDARPMASFFIRRGETDEELSEYFGSFNIVISYLYDPDGFFQINVSRCGKMSFIRGRHRPDEEQDIHATEVLLEALQQIAIFDADPTPALEFRNLNGSTLVGDWLAVHPGSGSEKKNWPITRWIELIEQIARARTERFMIVGGEADRERLNDLRGRFFGERFQFVENRPLVEVARRLQQCRAFVGHDSGVTHLAAAVGIPGLCLWGETREAIWRPRSERFAIVKHEDGLAELDPAEVGRQLTALLVG